MITHLHIAERLFNTPLLIHPGKLDAIIAGLAPRLGLQLEGLAPEAYTTPRGDFKREGGYRVVDAVETADQAIARLPAAGRRITIAGRGARAMSDDTTRAGGADRPERAAVRRAWTDLRIARHAVMSRHDWGPRETATR